MKVKDIDHIVIFAQDLKLCMRFYHEVLDLPIVEFTDNLLELQLGKQKLIFLPAERNSDTPANPTPGANSFCITVKDSLEDLSSHLANYGVNIIDGPKKVHGSNGMMNSLFINDPENNVIEIRE
ncbi:VOC family protein [Apilactobacillus bombintestini]|uniref:Lactoylglutathione lyase n=1 Tax=Apilactobacillus bombintestini TaxID=2419772 RepID=A0A387AZ12_9LACO|nr:VOC family protein [Apilactobacillus bombintestini]AYF92290.1 lactoylglutathione lyase [Apilactobacillus bombintestini]